MANVSNTVSRTAESLVSVNVLDVNDNPPVFVNGPRQSVALDLNAPVGRIVAELSVYDADKGDNRRVECSLTTRSQHSGQFEVDYKCEFF